MTKEIVLCSRPAQSNLGSENTSAHLSSMHRLQFNSRTWMLTWWAIYYSIFDDIWQALDSASDALTCFEILLTYKECRRY